MSVPTVEHVLPPAFQATLDALSYLKVTLRLGSFAHGSVNFAGTYVCNLFGTLLCLIR